MPKKIILLFLIALMAAGCSARDWLAKYYMLRAEETMGKAAQLKSKKISYDARKELYIDACSFFVKAYETDVKVFTVARIEEAVDACWKAEDKEHEEMFKTYGEKYAKDHPVENEYGDAGVNMNLGE